VPRVISKMRAEYLLTVKGEDVTPEDIRELGRWWRAKLRRDLAWLRKHSPLARKLVVTGKADADASTRKVVEAVAVNRGLLVDAARRLAETERYAEFRSDFLAIADAAEMQS
jgi:hypothetical protein